MPWLSCVIIECQLAHCSGTQTTVSMYVAQCSALLYAAEYIEDTEEYINIELDSSRNRLIRLELIINTATFSIAMYSLVAGEQF